MSLLERIYYFHSRILNNRYPNSGDLAREFEVSPATAHRDIAYLRDRLLAPLSFDQQKNGYFYTEQGFRLPFDDTPRLVMLLGMLRKMAEETGLTELPELKNLQRKLNEIVSPEKRPIDDVIHCEWIETESVEASVFSDVLHGLLTGTRIRLVYRSPSGSESERTVDPLKLVSYQGRWYILAWCHLRRGRRMFHLARVHETSRTDTRAEHAMTPDDDWLTGSFGIFKGRPDERYQAQILFTDKAAKLVRQQHWHPDQHMEETGSGVILSLPVADDRELIMKVLQFGAQACILKPEALRQKVKDEIHAMTRVY